MTAFPCAIRIRATRFVDEEETTPAPYYDNPQRMFIRTSTGLRIDDATEADNIYTKLANNDAVKWQGPYYNIHRDEALDEHVDSSDLPHPPSRYAQRSLGQTTTSFSSAMKTGRPEKSAWAFLVEPDGVVEQYAPGSFGSNIPVSDKIDRPAVLSLGPRRPSGRRSRPDQHGAGARATIFTGCSATRRARDRDTNGPRSPRLGVGGPDRIGGFLP